MTARLSLRQEGRTRVEALVEGVLREGSEMQHDVGTGNDGLSRLHQFACVHPPPP